MRSVPKSEPLLPLSRQRGGERDASRQHRASRISSLGALPLSEVSAILKRVGGADSGGESQSNGFAMVEWDRCVVLHYGLRFGRVM